MWHPTHLSEVPRVSFLGQNQTKGPKGGKLKGLICYCFFYKGPKSQVSDIEGVKTAIKPLKICAINNKPSCF